MNYVSLVGFKEDETVVLDQFGLDGHKLDHGFTFHELLSQGSPYDMPWLKGPILYPYLDLYISSWNPLQQHI